MRQKRTAQQRPNRRAVLRSLGAAGLLAGLAGCGGRGPPEDVGALGDETTTTEAGATQQQTTTGPECPELSGEITEDLTLGGDCDSYRVSGPVRVLEGALLTIEPGTSLIFGQDASLSIQETGALSAVGRAGEPIMFTGAQQTRGYWQGLQFAVTDRVENELTYCVIEHAGGDRFSGAQVSAGLAITREARLTVRHTTIRNNAGYGAFLGPGMLEVFTNNEILENAIGPVWTLASQVHSFTEQNTYAGNGVDVIDVRGDEIGTRTMAVWKQLDVPYRILPDTRVRVVGNLTIESGTTVLFGQESSLSVEEDGSLTAVGEENLPIRFTGEQEVDGYWQGVRFAETRHPDNALHYCTIEYAGSERFVWAEVPACLAVTNGAEVELQYVTLRESPSHGLFLGEGRLRDSHKCHFETCKVPIRVHASGILSLDSTFTFGNIDQRHVEVRGQEVDHPLGVDWLPISYHVLADTGISLVGDGQMAVRGNTRIEFGKDAFLEARKGVLNLLGQSDGRIVLTGSQEIPGHWRGVRYHDTHDDRNEVENVIIEYGGSKKWPLANSPANVTVTGDSYVELTDVTLRDSDGYGLHIRDSDVSIDGVIYEGNRLGPRDG